MSRKFDQIWHAPKPKGILKSAALVLAWGLFFADPLDMQAAVFLGGPFTLTDPQPGPPLATTTLATPYPGNIVVADLATIPLTGSNVTLTINSFARSGRPDDLDMLLVGPTGASLIVWSDVGGTGGATGTLTITLSDLGASFLPDLGPLASGTFKPTNESTVQDTFPAPAPGGPYGNPGPAGAGTDTFATEFNGTNPNGTWSLYILDDTPNSGGETTTIGSWSLDINATVIPPSALATWLNAPASADWNTGTNWSGGIAPVNPGDTATFNTSTNTSPTLSSNVTIDSITFNPGASPFTIQTNGRVLTLLGVGIVNNSGNVQTINNNNSTSGGAVLIGRTVFTNAATADSTVITNSGIGTSTQFFNSSTAGNATITNSGAGSFTAFTQGASGGNAALINANPTAFITIAELNGAGTTAGSIAGNGTIFLGSKNLTVGGNQQSTVFTGVISDGESSNLPPSLATQQPSYVGGSLTKVGTGTLTLTGINTYTGGTNLNGGILAVNSDVNLGTGALSFNGGTLQALVAGGGIDSSKAVNLAAGGGTFLADAGTASTLSGAITGVGAWAKAGPGTLTLTGANTYSGGTTVSAGTLQLGNGGTTGSIIGNVVDNGILAFNRSDSVTFGGVISGAGSVQQNGAGTTVLTGDNTYTGGTIINAGTLQLGNGGAAGSITGNVIDNGILAFNRSDSLAFAGVISGSGIVQQNGTGTTVLVGANTYAGGTILNGGILAVNGDGNLGTGLLSFNGGTLEALGAGGGITSIKAVNLAAGGGTFLADAGTASTLSGAITGVGAWAKAGPGTLTLTGANTYSGGTTVSAGTLQLGNGGTTGSIIGNVVDNGILAFNRSDSVTFGGVISGAGSVQQNGAGTTVLTGDNTYTGGTIINAGTLQLGNGGAAGSITGNVIDNGILAFNRSDSLAFAGVISGSGIVQQNGTGTTVLVGANTYAGGTILNGGILAVNGDGNLGTGLLSFNGGTLEALGAGGGITSIKAVNLAAGGGTFLADAGTASTLSGAITGVGAWAKAGPGTLTLTGANTYSGGTTVSAGTLQLGNGGTTGSIIGNVVDNGILAFNRSDSVTFGGVISGAGSVQQNGAGTTVLTGDNTYTGGTIINAGTLQLGNGGAAGSITGNVIDNGILAFNRSDSLAFAGVISGSGIVQQNGTGTTVLVGANTYAGGTILNGGILAVNGDGNLGTGLLSFNGGTLEALGAGGGITSIKAVNLAAGGGTFLAETGTTSTLSGLITGVGAWTKSGSGTLTLSGANTYGGGTTIAGGTIVTQNASALGIGPVAFGNGTALQVQNLLNVNGNWTVSPGTASVSGGTVQTFGDFNLGGGGTLIANASFNIPGAANINSSGLVVNSAFTVNDNVNLSGSSTAIVNGVLTSASVNVNDASSLVVNNSGTVAANVNVGPSALLGLFGRINGSVINAGFFQGTGVVNGNVFNSGIVSPGASIGTLTINGNYTQSASGTLRIEVAGASPGQYDVLVVNGRASLAGRLQLLRIGGFRPRIGDQLAFLTASGGVSGTFDTIESDFLATDSIVVFDVIYLPNAVALGAAQGVVILEAVQGSFAEFASIFGGTPNAVAVGEALDSAVGDPRASELIGFLNNQTLTDLREDIVLISPEQLTSIFVIGVSLANVQTANLERRMDDIRAGSSGFSSAGFAINGSGPPFQDGFAKGSGAEGKSDPAVFAPVPENQWGIFATGLGEFTNVDSTFNARGYDLATGGFSMGIDYRIGSHFAIGLAGGYAYTGADLFNGSSIQVNGGKLGLYATAFGSGFYLDTAVIGGLSGYDTRRTALEGTARGDTVGGDLNMLVAGGYDWKKGGLRIGPTASFQYTLVGFGDFTESGSLAPLAYPSQNEESFRTAFGMRASYDWKIGPIRLIPEVRLAWQHEFGDTDYSLVSSFASGAGNSFTVSGPEIGRDSMLIGAGFAIHWNDRISTYAYYDGELFRTNYLSNNVSAGFRVTF